MLEITILNLIQFLMFCIGSALIIYAGKQDEKTRNPYILIPALIALGMSAGGTTFTIITLACLIIFILPEKVNKVIGKADLLLFASALTIIILNQNVLLTALIYLSLTITLILLLFNKKEQKEVPLIHYYAQGYIGAIITSFLLGLLALTWSFL